MPKMFDHEKLHVYQACIEFIIWLQKILERIPKRHAVYDQLDRASTSIPLNIAEGNGKFTPKDRCKYFDIARGSAFEFAAALDVVVAKAILKENEIIPGKEILHNIVSMLVGLIKSNSADRVCESLAQYGHDYD
jgi:four helix bundle protein